MQVRRTKTHRPPVLKGEPNESNVLVHSPKKDRSKKRTLLTLRYRIQLVLFSILIFCLLGFLYLSYFSFRNDKKLFVLDMNAASGRSVAAELTLDIFSRVLNLQILLDRLHRTNPDYKNLFEGTLPSLKDELLGMRVYERKESGEVRQLIDYQNGELLEKSSMPQNALNDLDRTKALPYQSFFDKGIIEFYNRSYLVTNTGSSSASTDSSAKASAVGIVSFLLQGRSVRSEEHNFVIAADFLQDFFQTRLGSHELTEIFVVERSGQLISHPNKNITAEFSQKTYEHPVISRVKGPSLPKESLTYQIKGEDYLAAIQDLGFGNLVAIVQVPASLAFQAIKSLVFKVLLLSALTLLIAFVLSVLGLSNLEKIINQTLKNLMEKIQKDQVDITSKISVVQAVASSVSSSPSIREQIAENEKTKEKTKEQASLDPFFQKMTEGVAEVVQTTAEQARMKNELKTMQLMQSTLLSTPEIETKLVELAHHLVSASETGGDFWDAFLSGKKLTVIVGDATGHGAPAALVTAVAKSCFATLNSLYKEDPLGPEQFLSILNKTIAETCKGKLLMTMLVLQLDLETGSITLANAGHESPVCLRSGKLRALSQSQGTRMATSATEMFFVRGERLGYDSMTSYESKNFQLDPGDLLVLYTDGITEAPNTEGKEWGERKLLKTVIGDARNRNANKVKDDIVKAVNQHTQGTPQKDDITLVLLSWLEAGSQKAVWEPEPSLKTNEAA